MIRFEWDVAKARTEVIRALREIQKSIPRWSRQGGRKGYLDFVSQYLP
jgi:hypothetical protein